MVVEVDVGILQSWITIGIAGFGGICTLTVAGIRVITKPMVKALTDLNTTVKEINTESQNTRQRVSDIEMVHKMRGCDKPFKGV